MISNVVGYDKNGWGVCEFTIMGVINVDGKYSDALTEDGDILEGRWGNLPAIMYYTIGVEWDDINWPVRVRVYIDGSLPICFYHEGVWLGMKGSGWKGLRATRGELPGVKV